MVVLVEVIIAAYCFYKASINLHRTLLSSILKTKMSFFDVKPLGMIINRFSKDMETVGESSVASHWSVE